MTSLAFVLAEAFGSKPVPQTAADELHRLSTSADGAEQDSGTAPAGDARSTVPGVPGNPQDSQGVDDASIGLELGSRPGADAPAGLFLDQVALVADQPGSKAFTEGSAPQGLILPSGLVNTGGTSVEEGSNFGRDGSSSTGP